jgi:hypothetical protein
MNHDHGIVIKPDPRSIRPDSAVRMSLAQVFVVLISVVSFTATAVLLYNQLDGRIRRLEEKLGSNK